MKVVEVPLLLPVWTPGGGKKEKGGKKPVAAPPAAAVMVMSLQRKGPPCLRQWTFLVDAPLGKGHC